MNQLVKRNTALEVKGLLEKNRGAIEAALPKHVSPDRLMRVAVGCIARTPALQRCSTVSLFQAIVQASTLGLDPGGATGEAYLVPYGSTATLIIGYRGLIELARRTGEVSLFYAEKVCINDTIKMSRGLNPDLVHEIPLNEDRGETIGFYAVFVLKDGSRDFDYMTKKEVDLIRKRSKAGGSGPWVTDYDQMALKTVIRRLAKRAPMSVELSTAVHLDNQATAGEPQAFDLPANVEVPDPAIEVSPIEQPAEINPGPLGIDPEAVKKANAEPEKVSVLELEKSLEAVQVSKLLATQYIIHDERLGWLQEGDTLAKLPQDKRRLILERLDTFQAACKAFEAEDLAKAEEAVNE